jgi:hemolysin D
MLIDGKRVNLSPGMNITAEIKTGQRRIIEFLLSPVQRADSESLRERASATPWAAILKTSP